MKLLESFLRSVLLIVLAVSALAPAASADNVTSGSRPKIGLVLKGGGALGFAHVGVLRVLEENRIPIDRIAGTSMGSIVGAAYASGVTLAEMDHTLSTTDWDEFFGEAVGRSTLDYRLKPARNREIYGSTKLSLRDGTIIMPTGAIEGQNIRPLFQKLFGNQSTPVNFDSLPIPFRAVTTDLETGKAFVPDRGDLSTIVRASMSVPGAFAPVEVGERLLVDGGLVDNLPIDVALDMGADILIVVDLQSDLAKRKDLQNLLSVTGQMVGLLLAQNSAQSRKLVRPIDIVIEPNVNGYTVTDFPKGKELAAIGETTARAMANELRRLALSPEAYAEYQAQRTHRIEQRPRLAFVRINNTSEIAGERINEKVRLKPGDEFDADIAAEDMRAIYQTGYFKTAQYDLVQENGETGLEVNLVEKDWLRSYTRFGFSLEDDLDGESSFRLAAAFRKNGLLLENGYGEIQIELGKSPRFGVELLQYLSSDSDWFVDSVAGIGRNQFTLRQNNEEIADYYRTQAGGGIGFGRRLGTYGETLVRYRREHGDIRRRVGDPALPEFDYEIGDMSAELNLDTLDRPDFPSRGFALSTAYTEAVEELGASDGFGELDGRVVAPVSSGKNTLILGATWGTTFGSRPVERIYSLGGFTQISGYPDSSLVASDYLIGQAIVYHRFSELQNPLFNFATYIGVTFEQSRLMNDVVAFERDRDIASGSIFVGADTPISPVYLSFGRASTNESAVYLLIGRVARSN